MKKLITIMLCSAFLFGCAMGGDIFVESYLVNADHIETIKNSVPNKINVSGFSSEKGVDDQKLQMRAAKVKSPIGDSYSKYIEESVRREFILSKKFDSKSIYCLSGVLVNQEFGGFPKGKVTVRFILKKDNNIVFEKEYTATKKWGDKFVGIAAVRDSCEKYKFLIEDVIGQLLNDHEFNEKLK